jgi:Domain of unknown function (DUF4386)
LRLAGGLLVGGFLLSVVVTHFHPAGHEDNHPVVFAKYARNHDWVAIHLGQFAGVLLALAGFLVLYRVLELRGDVLVLTRLALGAAITSAAIWAVLQAVDGVALKHAVDAWAHASGTQKSIRFADAETVRSAEEGINSYFRLLLGVTIALYGVAIARTRIVAGWLGWVAVVGGLLYMASGIAVAYRGFQSGFLDVTTAAFLVLFLVFVIGLLVVSVRMKERHADAAGRR